MKKLFGNEYWLKFKTYRFFSEFLIIGQRKNTVCKFI